MGNGIRSIDLMMRGDIVVQTKLRVEEVECLIDHSLTIGVGSHPVTGILHLEADVAILQIEEAVQSWQEVVVDLAIHVPVSLLGVVAIVFEVGQQLHSLGHVFHPLHQSEVVAAVLVPAPTKGRFYILMIVIHQRGHEGIEVVVHLLLADEVALQLRILIKPHAVRQILHQFTACLILFVIALTLGIMACHVQVQVAREALVPQQLVVLLVVVIRLTVIIMHVTIIIIVLSARVIGTAIEALLILRGVVPGMIGLFYTIPSQQFHHRIV